MGKIDGFDAKKVVLAGKNLIEASAGTGKTYSIAVLVLRLIIESGIPIKKILMVTFTKPAVAELESRIRMFVRQAYKYSMNFETGNPAIREVVDNAGRESSKIRLKEAVRSLDQLSVMTIHSYCERSLMQYPFETSQSFDSEIATDISGIREMVVNDYWRKKVATLDKDLFIHFTKILTREKIREALNKALEDKEYACTGTDGEDTLLQIKEAIQETDAAQAAFESYISDNFPAITARNLNGYAAKFVEANSASAAGFIRAYLEGYAKGTKYIQNSFPDEYALCSNYQASKAVLDGHTSLYIFHLFKQAIEELRRKVVRFKSDHSLIDFNDQISLLHLAVSDGRVNAALASQYEAVFIDEFQDTDIHQYEIFSRLFSEKILFYIGDPKQSIFGWRKADIETYKRAKGAVDIVYSMNLNFRSTGDLIAALNDFFSTDNPFADDQIGYQKVETGLLDLGSMTENNLGVEPFEIYEFNNKAEIENFVVNEIHRLLDTGEININGSRIKPSDIAVIVRTNKEGRSYKKALSAAGIPSITIDDAKVMSSGEAGMIRYLMEAVIQPSRGTINRVLLNPCFGKTTADVEVLDDELHLDQFRELKYLWHDSGIYNMLFRFFGLYQVRKFCLEMGIEGQRSLTNFYQVAEILHQAEMQNKFTPNELSSWCWRAQNDSNDENEQRVESQDDAVQVTTIHKCKGLTYNIVFAPHLDLVKSEHPVFEFREDGKYKFTYQPTDDQKKLWAEQTEQENRRLIYVALTRARYKACICINNSRYYNDSSIKKFPAQQYLKQVTGERIASVENIKPVKPAETLFSTRPIPAIDIKNTFGIHSFSTLSKAHHSAPFEKVALGGPGHYDQFIFQELGRGASVGIALHSIFERLDFNNEDSWEQSLQNASKYYPNIIKFERLNLFWQMVTHVMDVELNCDGEKFALNQVKNEHRLPELEFCFSLKRANKIKINELLGEEADLAGEADIEGLMTGFIDLFFMHDGRYYVLDWKSNFLGNSPEDYDEEGLSAAMKANNYNLQYYIYSVAMKRWLEKKIPGFSYENQFGGVIYLFLRGVRSHDNSTGVFFRRPDLDTMNRIEELFL
ncbi:MAG: UvrD-helicase domain-containing protein [Bacteroidota bacterium]